MSASATRARAARRRRHTPGDGVGCQARPAVPAIRLPRRLALSLKTNVGARENSRGAERWCAAAPASEPVPSEPGAPEALSLPAAFASKGGRKQLPPLSQGMDRAGRLTSSAWPETGEASELRGEKGSVSCRWLFVAGTRRGGPSARPCNLARGLRHVGEHAYLPGGLGTAEASGAATRRRRRLSGARGVDAMRTSRDAVSTRAAFREDQTPHRGRKCRDAELGQRAAKTARPVAGKTGLHRSPGRMTRERPRHGQKPWGQRSPDRCQEDRIVVAGQEPAPS